MKPKITVEEYNITDENIKITFSINDGDIQETIFTHSKFRWFLIHDERMNEFENYEKFIRTLITKKDLEEFISEQIKQKA